MAVVDPPIATHVASAGRRARFEVALPWLALAAAGVGLPLLDDFYVGVIAQRACIYWILVAGLNLVVGFAGQIAIGWVALLTVGAYTTAVLTAGTVTSAWDPYLALVASGVGGAVFGGIVGLPALRLRNFYFAISTLGFATIVTQVALAWKSVTGGGIGTPGPVFPWPFDPGWGFYYFCFGLAALVTWMTANIAASRFGRALVAIRDAEVAAEASGIAKPRLLITIFLFSGALAGIAGGLFSSLQSYITPDAFTFDLSILFFIAILIGGRGSILGPLLGTIILTVLPELAAPLVAWSTFLYAALLLVIVLAVPGGIADLLDYKNRRPLKQHREISTAPGTVAAVAGRAPQHCGDRAFEHRAEFWRCAGDRRAQPRNPIGRGAWADRSQRQRQDDGLERDLGVLCTIIGQSNIEWHRPAVQTPHARAGYGIARTFQTPRLIGGVSVIENVMIGGTYDGKSSFVESLMALPRHRRDEAHIKTAAIRALETVGLDQLAAVRADRLQHSELRFMEIARALMLRPAFLMLDEPAAGLSAEEIRRLGALIKAISRAGTGVLLVEHHADLIFDICDRVTVLNLGKVLAAGTPAEIRLHREVVIAYLGS